MIDKAGESYWSSIWDNINLPPPINPESVSINNYINRRFHYYFASLFSGMATKGAKLLEIGCANSVWLPYFATQYGFSVSGLDYSEPGSEKSRQILKRDNVAGDIFVADFFHPPADLIGQFDVVVSLGVVEHFEDTGMTLSAVAKFLRHGGVLITEVPNLSGVLGYLQKHFNRPVYDVHVPIDKKFLEQALRKAGLTVRDSRYLGSVSFHVNLEENFFKGRMRTLKKAVIYLLSSGAKLVWMMETIFGYLPGSRLLSPMIVSVAVKDK